ncbi:GNAT family N-acetyltransferase [Gracilibacillus oryzae]|uniref:GNAT family N-acetyltransferase n=2 Tax=Gracilibacillus oryzae TaxID=1672701 RepID=A0A7C8KQB2_9BACI|nr:GNAT family N-acetyltransferase [Gracilibacillus oryzae]
MRDSEQLAQSSVSQVVTPGHLLYGCLIQKSGALGEIRLKSSIELEKLRSTVIMAEPHTKTTSDYLSCSVSKEVLAVFEKAANYMKNYNQIHLNEGHLLKALINSHKVDHLLTEENKQIIIRLATSSRDMITHLAAYSFPDITSRFIDKVSKKEETELIQFMETHFSGWLDTIQFAFQQAEQNIYIARNDGGKIIGFAAYDTYQHKKGYFGPMGVLPDCRTKGVGYALLHYCLKDMKEIGYEYAIIGGAGPLEFYEKACRAVVIPLNE